LSKFYARKSADFSAVAAGADGVILEVHPQPDMAWSDGPLVWQELV